MHQPLHAVPVQFGSGVSVTFNGYMKKFVPQEGKYHTTSFFNYALGPGLFVQLDVGRWYGKCYAMVQAEYMSLSHFKDLTSNTARSGVFIMPIELGLSILGKIRPHVGLTFSFPISQEWKYQGGSVHREADEHLLRSLCIDKAHGYLIGIGFDFLEHVFLDLHFERQLKAVPAHPAYILFKDTTHKSYKRNKIVLTLGMDVVKYCRVASNRLASPSVESPKGSISSM